MRQPGLALPAWTLAACVVAGGALAQSCDVTIGAVTELSGSNGAVVRPISLAQQLALDHMNEAGGIINNCQIKLDIRDSQTQPTVAVDMARQLVDVIGVGAILGPVSSGLTLPLLTSVTVDKNVLVIASASSSPTFTELSHDGKLKGLFFRIQPSAALEALAAAKIAADAGFKKLSIIQTNNDWGNSIGKQFATTFPKVGGQILGSVKYNPDQPTYRSEVTKALEGTPDSAFMAMAKTDGQKIMREWLRLGGAQRFVFPLGVNDSEFIAAIGPEVFKDSWFITPGEPKLSSLQFFREAYQKKFNASPVGPGREQGYDSAVVMALAMHAAGTGKDGPKIAKAVYDVTDPAGEPIMAGPDEFKKALALIKQGKKVRYIGASGEINFDRYGDVSSPFLAWQVQNGTLVKVKEISIDEVMAVKKLTDG